MLLHACFMNDALTLSQLVFGGRLPERLLQVGVWDKDASQFCQVVFDYIVLDDALKTHASRREDLECMRHAMVGAARVAVVLLTTDVALKVLSEPASPWPPAARLLRRTWPVALVLDEVQRCVDAA